MEITVNLIFAMLTVFSIGMGVGAFFKEKKLEKTYSPWVNKYMSQKADMWKEFKKRLKA